MEKVAALPSIQRNELFRETAAQRGLLPAIIEKDFWVCWVLRRLFTSVQLADKLVFKGGTSLSKVYGLIKRFSEDIDLVLDWRLLGYGEDGQNPWEEQPSSTKQDKFNQEFNYRAQRYLEESFCPQLAELLADRPELKASVSATDEQTIDIHYPAAFEAASLRPQVKLEIGPLASWVPSARHVIKPYAAEQFPQVFEDPKCPLVAITAERTFWEKATILHQQAHRSTTMPSGYSRHYYDLYHLAASPIRQYAMADMTLLEDVVAFKDRFYRCPWAKYDTAKPGTFALLPTETGNKELESDYRKMQPMIFGEPPTWKVIIESLRELESEINLL